MSYADYALLFLVVHTFLTARFDKLFWTVMVMFVIAALRGCHGS